MVCLAYGAYRVGGSWRLIRRCACVLEIGEKHLHILEMMAFVMLNIQILLVSFPGNFLFLRQVVLHLSLYRLVHSRQAPGMMQFWATDCKSESVLPRSSGPLGKQWLWRLRAQRSVLHYLWVLFLHMTYGPFCKVTWGLAFFKPTAGNWPLCSRYVRNCLDGE